MLGHAHASSHVNISYAYLYNEAKNLQWSLKLELGKFLSLPSGDWTEPTRPETNRIHEGIIIIFFKQKMCWLYSAANTCEVNLL